MHRPLAVMVAVLASLSVVPAVAAPAGAGERALAALDARQKDMVARGDLPGLLALAAPDLTINAPTGRVLSHDEFFAMMRDGRIGAEAFERTVESIRIHGAVGVVMGSEVFTPTAGSELGRTWGARPLRRRYSNVYIRDAGRWRWLARHANVVPASAGAPARP
jgi:hypothetical protein